ncbi:MAG: sugar ABC transporter substrate-binding protein [Candidatus Omnitrophica bacterium]|nr:hypothetical protein [bacterium]NUN98118.1 sugar ABC transporter substrate-binding protein [Candidatus Omnitrophota bacterium]
MRNSTLLLLTIVVLVLLLLFVPVRPPEERVEGSETSESPSDKDREISILVSIWGMPWEDALFKDYYCREFERLHPNVRVRFIRLAGDMVSKYMLWHIRGDGTGADVLRQHTGSYLRLVDAGVNEPLDGYINHPETGIDDLNDYIPETLEAMTVNGRLYGLPADLNTVCLLYNKDLFDAYNREHTDSPISYPTNDWTWEDLRRAAKALTVRKGARTEIYGFDFMRSSGEFNAFLLQAGGRIWNEDKTRTLIDSPEALEVIRFWKDLTTELQIARPSAMRDTAMGPDKFFQFGKTAMLIDGTWRLPDVLLQAPGMRFGAVCMPRHRRAVSVGGSTLWAISSDSRNKEVAWEFIKFVNSPENLHKYWDMLWVAPPSRLSVLFSEKFKFTSGLARNGEVFIPGFPRESFEDLAGWMLEALSVNPETGKRRVTLEDASRYGELYARRLQVALDRIFLPESTYDPETELRRCAEDINLEISQKLRARGD